MARVEVNQEPGWFARLLERGADRASRPGQDDMMTRGLRHLAEKGFDPRVTIDVGAAKGYWSLAAASCFARSTFYLIDPLQESEPHLRRLSETDSRFNHLLTAVGDHPGELPMNVTDDLDGSTLLEYYATARDRVRTVPVTTIDRLLAQDQVSAPQLMKIDVQGYELHVLRGATKALASTEVLIVETSLYRFMPECPRIHEVFAFMAERGFHLFDLVGALRRPFQNDLGQLDLVFVSHRSGLMGSNRWH